MRQFITSNRQLAADYTVGPHPAVSSINRSDNPLVELPSRPLTPAALVTQSLVEPPHLIAEAPVLTPGLDQSVGSTFSKLSSGRYLKPQLALISMACLVFVIGLAVSLQTLETNHRAAAQVAALSKVANKQASGGQNGSLPSTTKPSSQAISQYVVAPDMARYIKIPKLGVYARVMQTGVTNTGAVGAPNNVFDTAWFTGSAKPSQPGATLIDGHVSSWTTHGVFYNLKQLTAGDQIQIIKGDGTTVYYQVVKSLLYSANNVNMQAALTPVTPGKPGLNLITCAGQVEKGTSEFSQRIIVFAQQM